ncbi:MAG: hypothetical protein H6738_18820 [Alphaproteobacteria bacterium]|nr:hypothetical protein [Alphaproteobacteria bacterium]MCB9698841.1 hypothetical protein [Alphaproteobacteria bacterium]
MNVAGALLDGLQRGVAPLDRLRRALYRVLAPWLGPWIRSREVRIGLHGALAVGGSLLLAAIAPLWMLALGPLLLGVPHLVADLRYLVAKPGLHRRSGAWVVAGLLVASSVTADLRWGLVGAALVPLASSGSLARRALAAAGLGALAFAAFAAPRSTALGLAHAHNVVAVVAWMTLAVALHEGAGSRAVRWGTTLAFFVGGALILGGALDPVLLHGPSLPGGPSIRDHLAALAPGMTPPWGHRWVVAFAYAQSVHYGLWLRIVPEEARERPAPRSWEASLRALRTDLGAPVFAAAVLLCVGLAVWGLADLAAAREGYLRLALFHGPLELAVLGLVAAEGRAVLRP